jgi:hypothetical protein
MCFGTSVCYYKSISNNMYFLIKYDESKWIWLFWVQTCSSLTDLGCFFFTVIVLVWWSPCKFSKIFSYNLFFYYIFNAIFFTNILVKLTILLLFPRTWNIKINHSFLKNIYSPFTSAQNLVGWRGKKLFYQL